MKDKKDAIGQIQNETRLPVNKIEKALELLIDQECTIPFVARYRKDVTGNLDEVQLRDILTTYEKIGEIEKRREYILEALKKLEKLTPDLEKKIIQAKDLLMLEDLYGPYKSKKKTKAQKALEAGIGPVAEVFCKFHKEQKEFFENEVNKIIDKKLEDYPNRLAVVQGCKDIIIEKMSHHPEIKPKIRTIYWDKAIMVSKVKKDIDKIKGHEKFKDFFDYSEPVQNLTNSKNSHRFMAMRRGMNLRVLKVSVELDPLEVTPLFKSEFYAKEDLLFYNELVECAQKAVTLYIHPSVEIEIKSELKALADDVAIKTFGMNLRNLLLQPYLGAKPVMGVDPGIKTGCKIVVIDNTGNLLADFVIYPHGPKADKASSKTLIENAIEHFKIEHVAVGNGTFGRETLAFLEENIQAIIDKKVNATMISEAGASIYSASDIAREEFPDKDATVRGSVSIARRFQDPLAELVKIDPKSIGVGQYQHDVNQSKLKKSLTGVVESCVNFVGVDLNTASAPLLSYISGIGPTLAKNIVSHRQRNGAFKTREQLLNVDSFGQKAFQQAGGFLRIYNGQNPLDATFVHPENYNPIEVWSKKQKVDLNSFIGNEEKLNEFSKNEELAKEIGKFTFEDIVKSLAAPGQDPRQQFKSIEFDPSLKQLSDLKVGQWYTGVITNITQFGAFVDIGLKNQGLLHRSEMGIRHNQDPLDSYQVGQEMQVLAKEVDLERERISLSLDLERPKQHKRPARTRPHPKGARQDHSKKPRHKRDRNGPTIKNNSLAKALKDFKV